MNAPASRTLDIEQEAAALLADALDRVESEGVRAWAQTPHNGPIWARIAESYLGKPDAASWLAARIVGEAIGLFG